MPEYYECIFVVRGTPLTHVAGAGAALACLAAKLCVHADMREDVNFSANFNGSAYYTTPTCTRLPAAVVRLVELSVQYPDCSYQLLFDGPHGLWETGIVRVRDGVVERADLWPNQEWRPDDDQSSVRLGTAPDGEPALVSTDSGAVVDAGPADMTNQCNEWVRAYKAGCAAHWLA